MSRKLFAAALAAALGLTGGAAQAQDTSRGPISSVMLPADSGQSSSPILSCTPNCDPKGSYMYGGAGLYFLQPVFETNPAYGVAHSNGGGLGPAVLGPITNIETVEQHDFRYGLDAAPELFGGYVTASGLGVRGRYFGYSHSASELLTAIPDGPDDQFEVFPVVPFYGRSIVGFGSGDLDWVITSNLRVNVIDLEVTQDWRPGRWVLQGAAGARYVHMSQSYFATSTFTVPAGEGGPAFDVETDIRADHNFNGLGPIVGLNAKRFIGESGLAVYGNSRASILFGTGKELYSIEESTVANGGFHEEFVTRQTDILPIIEMELGGEFGRRIGRAYVFGQMGVVGHAWLGGGNATNTTSIQNGGIDSSTNFGFVGVTIRAGMEF